MDFTKATFQQLLQVAYHEKDCPMDYKYKALFELHDRNERERNQLISRYKRKSSFSDKTYRIGK